MVSVITAADTGVSALGRGPWQSAGWLPSTVLRLSAPKMGSLSPGLGLGRAVKQEPLSHGGTRGQGCAARFGPQPSCARNGLFVFEMLGCFGFWGLSLGAHIS